MSMYSLGVSTAIMIGWCLTAQIGRRTARNIVKDEGIVPVLINEAIAAAELCACCFELIIVADNFGVAAYAVYLFLLTIWWTKVWGDASACPYTHMEDLLDGRVSLKDVALRTWAELMGGCCVYRLVQVVWWFELAETHHGRAFEECSADLQVNPYVGAVIEGVATLLCRLSSKALSEKGSKFSSIFDSFICTSLVVAAFNFSGGYFNPVLATALKWGCHGHTNIEHIIVYWIGACVGAIISVPLYRVPAVRRFLLRETKEKTE